MNAYEREEEKYFVYTAMQKYGGHFVKALGVALMSADWQNTKKIKQAFPEYWDEYKKLGKKLYENTNQ